MYVGANWNQDWRIGGFPFALWNIKDSQDVRGYVGALKDAQIDGGGDGSAWLKCRLLNVHSTPEKAFPLSTKGDTRLGNVLTRDDHLVSVPGAVWEVSETVSSPRLQRMW